MAKYMQEEHKIREANLRLQRKLQLEMERREQLCRHLSESESSLEMDDERWGVVKVSLCEYKLKQASTFTSRAVIACCFSM